MATNEEIWQQYSNFAIDLSNNARKLAFGGAAIAWVFKTEESTFPFAVLCALFFIISFFILDISQYFLGATRLKKWIEAEEKKKINETGSFEGEYKKPIDIDIPSYHCWIAKIFVLLIGYFFLGIQVFL